MVFTGFHIRLILLLCLIGCLVVVLLLMVDWQGEGRCGRGRWCGNSKVSWCYRQSVLASMNPQKASERITNGIKAIVLGFMVTPFPPSPSF